MAMTNPFFLILCFCEEEAGTPHSEIRTPHLQICRLPQQSLKTGERRIDPARVTYNCIASGGKAGHGHGHGDPMIAVAVTVRAGEGVSAG